MAEQPMRRMRDAFIQAILDHMRREDDVFFLSADFGSPVLDLLTAERPERFINVGIAEQNLVNLSVGLALEGFRVVAYAIAPFITMRCLEQTRVSLAILSQVRSMNVNLVGVGAGFSYDVSGPTHQALEDIAIMRALPNIAVYCPSDAAAAFAMAQHAMRCPGPKYFRLDGKPLPDLPAPVGRDEVCRGFRWWGAGGETAIIATGYLVHEALQARDLLAARAVETRVVDLLAITGFDGDALRAALEGCRGIVTAQEAFVGRGGLDGCIAEWAGAHGLRPQFDHAGLPPHYSFDIGNRGELLRPLGLDAASLAERVIRMTGRPNA